MPVALVWGLPLCEHIETIAIAFLTFNTLKLKQQGHDYLFDYRLHYDVGLYFIDGGIT